MNFTEINIVTFPLILIIMSLFICMTYLIKGPTLLDRILSLDLIGIIIVNIVILVVAILKKVIILDVAIIFALVSFVSAVVFCDYIVKSRRKNL